MKTTSATNELWSRISRWSMSAGSATARPVMLLYFVMTDRSIPSRLRAAIARRLSRMFPDNTGEKVELMPVTATLSVSQKYITPEMEQRADSLLERLNSTFIPFSFK